MEDFIPENLENSVPPIIKLEPPEPVEKPDLEERICNRCNHRSIPRIEYENVTSVNAYTKEIDFLEVILWIILVFISCGLAVIYLLFRKQDVVYKSLVNTVTHKSCKNCGSRELEETPEQKKYQSYLYAYDDYLYQVEQRKRNAGRLPQKSFMELYFFPSGSLPKWFEDLSIGEKLVVSLTIVAMVVGVVCLFMLF